MKIMSAVLSVVVLGAGLLAAACQSAPATDTSTVQTPNATSNAATNSAPTMAQMAASGQGLFSNRCGRCHGQRGQGLSASALIGATAHLDHYENGAKLLEYISKSMPQDAPGSLQKPQNIDVTCFLLTENKLVAPEVVFTEPGLAEIKIIDGDGHAD